VTKVIATPAEALRARIRWHRGHLPEADERPEQYSPRLTLRRSNLMLGTLRGHDGQPRATFWVQRLPLGEDTPGSRRDATSSPAFALLFREGRWWRQLGRYRSVPLALQALAASLDAGGLG
jgi:hypothetical protein